MQSVVFFVGVCLRVLCVMLCFACCVCVCLCVCVCVCVRVSGCVWSKRNESECLDMCTCNRQSIRTRRMLNYA